jgi:nucleotide-binding universal stress UspA family protein
MLPIHTVLCPLDFSDPSYKALQVAIEMAAHFKAELVLAHFVAPAHPGVPADPLIAFEGQEVYETTARKAAEEQLTIATQGIPAEIKTRTTVAIGDAADEIVRLADTEAADLIVISTHGLTGWRHLVFGSVAEKVVRLSERPVLVIPAHETTGDSTGR